MEGKLALVTGGLTGLGLAIAQTLAQRKVHLVLHYFSSDERSILKVPERLRKAGAPSIHLVQADFRRPAAVDRLFVDLEAAVGRLDILINNAGVFQRRPLAESSWEDWEAVLAVNLVAPAQCIRHAVKLGARDVVNVADIAWNKSWKYHAAYVASKAALVSLTRVAALEYAPDVRVNAVAPGLITFPTGHEDRYSPILSRIPAGRPGTEEEVAQTVTTLLDAPAYVTGQVLAVDGGLSLR